MNEITIPIHETFTSFQGEGVHSGRKAHFIRTFGCPVHCPWCDSAGTWHKDWVPSNIRRVPVAELIAEAKAANAAFVVITGGEPCVQPNIVALGRGLQNAGLLVHLETCGAYPVDTSAFSWITVSPKEDKLPVARMLGAADELKIIVTRLGIIKWWIGTIMDIGGFPSPEIPWWLHPEWSRRADKEILDYITLSVLNYPSFRAGWQVHKLYRADALDPRAADSVPLGGNPQLGSST